MIKRVRSRVRTRQHQISVSCWILSSSMALLVATAAHAKMELAKLATFSTPLRPGMWQIYNFPFRSLSLRPCSPSPYSGALLAVVSVVRRQKQLSSQLYYHRHRRRERSKAKLARGDRGDRFLHPIHLRHNLLLVEARTEVRTEARTGSAPGSKAVRGGVTTNSVYYTHPPIVRLFATGSRTLLGWYLTMMFSVLGTLDVELWSPF